MLCPSWFPLKEGKDNGSGMEELGPGKSPGPVPGPGPRPFIVGRLRRADTFEMLPKRLVLVNWVRGDTSEEKGLWAGMPELGGCDPPIRLELVRSREGFTEGVPPSWLEGPDGTIIEAKLACKIEIDPRLPFNWERLFQRETFCLVRAARSYNSTSSLHFS